MQRWLGVLVAAGISTLSVGTVFGTSPEDGKAAFERREETMKRMGRPFYLGIGRVVKGSAAYGPETVMAAKTVGELANALDRSLFPPGVRTWRRAGSSRRSSPRWIRSIS
jgi:cytochrome c556